MKINIKSAIEHVALAPVYGIAFAYGAGKAIVAAVKDNSDEPVVIENVDQETGEITSEPATTVDVVIASAKETAEITVTTFKEWCADFYNNRRQLIGGFCIGFFGTIAAVTITSCIMAIA